MRRHTDDVKVVNGLPAAKQKEELHHLGENEQLALFHNTFKAIQEDDGDLSTIFNQSMYVPSDEVEINIRSTPEPRRSERIRRPNPRYFNSDTQNQGRFKFPLDALSINVFA